MKTHDEIKLGLYNCTRLGGCAACPYFDRGIVAWCTPVLASDALAYIQKLEGQVADLNKTLEQAKYEKPLVPLTLNDVLKLDDIGDAWWVEYKGGNLIPSILTDDCHEYGKQILDGYEYELWNYGKTWRCWSRKPTDEERKAAKWDE